MLLLLRRFSRVRLCATPQTAAHQAPPSLGFSRQEHWSGLPFPSPIAFLIVQLSHPYMATGKTRALTTWTFVGKVMCLHFNMLSRLVIAFLSRSKHLLISWLQSPSAVILEPPKIKSLTVSLFPHLFAKNDGTRCHDLGFLNVEYEANFFTLLFHFHQEAL